MSHTKILPNEMILASGIISLILCWIDHVTLVKSSNFKPVYFVILASLIEFFELERSYGD